MGCVQAKTNSPTHGSQGLDKLKVDHGYVKGGGEGRPIGLKAPGKEPVKLVKVNAEVKADSGGGGKGGDCVVSRKTEKGNVSGRLTVKQTGGDDDDIVDGWPKWLVENVPPEVLDGLVPKSADSYDKLAKVICNQHVIRTHFYDIAFELRIYADSSNNTFYIAFQLHMFLDFVLEKVDSFVSY